MGRYLVEVAIALTQNPQDFAEDTRPIVVAAGGRLEEYSVSAGGDTAAMLVAAPDHSTMAAIAAAILASGAITSIKSTSLLTAEEAVGAMRKARELA